MHKKMIFNHKDHKKMKILIDNGHGCNTPGKRSPDGRFREYAWVREIARAIVNINKEDNVSIILVEQNSRMALKITHRAYVMVTGKIALEGQSSVLRNDERVQQAYLGGAVQQ